MINEKTPIASTDMLEHSEVDGAQDVLSQEGVSQPNFKETLKAEDLGELFKPDWLRQGHSAKGSKDHSLLSLFQHGEDSSGFSPSQKRKKVFSRSPHRGHRRDPKEKERKPFAKRGEAEKNDAKPNKKNSFPSHFQKRSKHAETTRDLHGASNAEKIRGVGRSKVSRRSKRNSQSSSAKYFKSQPPESTLRGWSIHLFAEPLFIEEVAKRIKLELKAYPLFELSRLMMSQPQRYQLLLKKKPSVEADAEDIPTPLWQAQLDQTVWESRKDAVLHLLKNHREHWYRVEKVNVDPPKGEFRCVVRCRRSATLLGPPNYHGYQNAARTLYRNTFSGMSWNEFEKGLERLHDPELLETWKQEVSQQEVFFPAQQEEPLCWQESKELEESEVTHKAQEAEKVVSESDPSQEAMPVVQTDQIDQLNDANQADQADKKPLLEDEQNEPTDLSPTTEPKQPSEAIESEEQNKLDDIRLDSYFELEQHFLKHHADTAIQSIDQEVQLPGKALVEVGSLQLRLLLENLLYDWKKFPLKLAQSLGKELSLHGLAIFKAHGKILYAGVARPAFQPELLQSLKESLSQIITYLQKEHQASRQKQWQGLLALFSHGDHDTATGEKALAKDLGWLLHQGYVTHFAMGNLEVVPVKPTPLLPKNDG